MDSKKYKCKIEITTRPQVDGKRLTFYPEDIIEAKFLRNNQVERLLDMGVIEEVKKKYFRTSTPASDIENEGDDGS